MSLAAPSFPAAARRYGLVAAGVATWIVLQARLWPFVSPDMQDFLLPWWHHIAREGVIGAFAEPFGDYAPTYLYLLAASTLLAPWMAPAAAIKLLSAFGTIFLAWSMARLARGAGAPDPWLAGLLVLLLPTPLLNAAFLGQCDALWVGCCLLAVAAGLERRTMAMVLWAGAAVSFKAQAAFIAPFIIGLLIRRREPLGYWAVPPAVYAAAMLPAFAAGWPAHDLLTVYLRQAGTYDHVGNGANLWVWGRVFAPATAQALVPAGLLLGAVAAAVITAFAARRRDEAPSALLALALLPALALPWLLPKMHERYFLLADMLAFALAFALRTRHALALALLVNASSLLALIAYTQPTPVPVLAGALLNSVALLLLIERVTKMKGGERAPVPLATAVSAG